MVRCLCLLRCFNHQSRPPQLSSSPQPHTPDQTSTARSSCSQRLTSALGQARGDEPAAPDSPSATPVIISVVAELQIEKLDSSSVSNALLDHRISRPGHLSSVVFVMVSSLVFESSLAVGSKPARIRIEQQWWFYKSLHTRSSTSACLQFSPTLQKLWKHPLKSTPGLSIVQFNPSECT
ncbi:hypothetical protein F2Q70_00008507 [Brassica cretica]|uniref:Uncharacterized protein n=1 Tax=Brassica cretica TaxID=69181 RepID=A0A8S9M3S3_BRACR|nr:hypothetical protein F2Q70_00008507 [Brassica cretica]